MISRSILKTQMILTLSVIIAAFPLKMLSQDIDNCKSTLNQLDEVLEKKDEFERIKKKKIAQLENKIKETPESGLYDLYQKLYYEYELYNFDSAFKYMSMMRDMARADNDNDKIIGCNLNLAFCCVSAGLFFEANDILQEVEKMQPNDGERIRLYSTYAKLYLDMARSTISEPHFSQYNQKSIYYSNEIIKAYNEDDPAILPHLANIYRCQQDYKAAAEVISRYMQSKDLNIRSLTLCAGGLGEFSLMLGDTISAVAYLSYTSIQDIKAVTKETPGLSLLAGAIYKQGNIERAFNYANIALDDANFYNASHRKVEVGNILPIIDAQRYGSMKKQKNVFFANTIMLSVLLLIAIIFGIIIIRQIKQLKKARRMIEAQNSELLEKNDSLQETNKIKEEYIGMLFSLNSAYMTELEEFQKLVKRKLVVKQYEDLLRTISKIDAKKEREHKLSAFDNIILKLFPNFFNQFNSLFNQQDHYTSGSNNILTPEMRIFALIRLGVNDSDEIAKILNYSVHTINTYKTKTKKRSLVPNDEFEDQIKAIVKHKS